MELLKKQLGGTFKTYDPIILLINGINELRYSITGEGMPHFGRIRYERELPMPHLIRENSYEDTDDPT